MSHSRRQRDLFSINYDDCLAPDDGFSEEHPDDLDGEQRFAKRRRIEDNARRYLNNGTLHIFSAALRGPFPLGSRNPWRNRVVEPKNKTTAKVTEQGTVETPVLERNLPELSKNLGDDGLSLRPQLVTEQRVIGVESRPQTRRSKILLQETKQLDLVRSDTPMDGLPALVESPGPRDTIQSWLRRVSTGPQKEHEAKCPDTPSKPPLKSSKRKFKTKAMTLNPGISAHPRSTQVLPTVTGFTPINHSSSEVITGSETVAPTDNNPSRLTKVSNLALTGQQRVLESAEKCLSPHRFKVPPKPISIAKPGNTKNGLEHNIFGNTDVTRATRSAQSQRRIRDIKRHGGTKRKAESAMTLPLIAAAEKTDDHSHISAEVSVLQTQPDHLGVGQQHFACQDESLCAKVTDSVPVDSMAVPAQVEPVFTYPGQEDSGPRHVPSFPERQDSKAYSPFSCDLSTQVGWAQVQGDLIGEVCSPFQSPEMSLRKAHDPSNTNAQVAWPIASFRQVQSPGATEAGYMRNKSKSTTNQDLKADSNTSIFGNAKKSDKGNSTKPVKRASFVNWSVSKPFLGSDENKDPENTMDREFGTNHCASQVSVNSASSQPALRKRSSLKQLHALTQCNSQPLSTSTPLPSVTLLPSASFALAAESGTAMPQEYEMAQRMFRSNDSFDIEDVDIEATLDDASAFLDV